LARRPFSLAVVGADHPNPKGPTRRFGIALCKPGDAIELRREPKNVADENAVAVYSERGIQLGYLTAERAAWIGGMIANGREICALFQCKAQFGAIIRIGLDGVRPDIPQQLVAEEQRDDPDFYPDEIYPDD